MPAVGDLSLFLAAAVVLAATPRPAVLYIVARSAGQGRGAGLASCLGVAIGGLAHVLATALGLSAVLASSALAFNLLKYAGAGYLIWLGFRKLTRAEESTTEARPGERSLWRVFRQGVALFFLAFVPQFVDPSRGAVAFQFAFLGGLFIVIALCTDMTCMTWCLLASGAGSWLKRHSVFVRSEKYVTGGVYLGLGVAAAFSGHGRT